MRTRLSALALAAFALAAEARGQGSDVVASVRRQLASLEATARDLSRAVLRLSDSFLAPSLARPVEEAQSRLSDGQVAYFLKHYTQASIILFDIVEDARHKGSPLYEEALFYLADSLYQNRNYVAARKYFDELLKNPRSRYYQDALARVVSMALVTGHHEEIDLYYSRLVRSGAATIAPEIPYLYGKSLYERGRTDAAMAVFASIPTTSPYFFQARFFLGALEAKLGRMADAVKHFLELYQYDPAAYRGQNEAETARIVARNRQILQLTHLALGRVYYEIGDLDRAAQAFQEVHRKSELFPEALHELAWTWIKAKQYEKARRALEILMLSRHDIRFIPEAQVLLGDLQLLMKRTEEATKTYTSVKTTFEPIRRELQAMVARHSDPVRYFHSILSEKVDQLDPSAMLPPIARRWARASDHVVKAMRLVRDLAWSRREIDESKRIIGRLEAAVTAPDKLEMYPVLREGRAAALEIVNRMLTARRVLNFLEWLLSREAMEPAQRSLVEEAARERERIEKVFDTIPRSKEDYLQRRKRQQERIAQVDAEVHRQSVKLDGLKAQVVALMTYWRETQREKRLSPEQERRVLEGIEAEKREIRDLEQHLERLRQLLAGERARAGVGDEALAADDRVRAAYAAALEREERAVSAARDRLAGERRALAGRIASIRERLARDLGAIAAFRQRLAAQVEERAREFARRVAAEKALVEVYDRELAAQEARSERVAGEAAYASFRQAQRKFYNLVIRADSGLTEIAWREKEARSRRVKQLVVDRKTELKRIQDEFQDVLRDE